MPHQVECLLDAQKDRYGVNAAIGVVANKIGQFN